MIASAVAPPVPIPNTEVKRCSPDDSASLGCAKVGHRQNYAPLLGTNKGRGFLFNPRGKPPAHSRHSPTPLRSFPIHSMRGTVGGVPRGRSATPSVAQYGSRLKRDRVSLVSDDSLRPLPQWCRAHPASPPVRSSDPPILAVITKNVFGHCQLAR